ncbi:MAG: cyclic lactone autoinducer peptide [Lachnoclostridium sp.]|nr:cyclic lactone autoinducer peptide [Lachnoclostridium sp.]
MLKKRAGKIVESILYSTAKKSTAYPCLSGLGQAVMPEHLRKMKNIK